MFGQETVEAAGVAWRTREGGEDTWSPFQLCWDVGRTCAPAAPQTARSLALSQVRQQPARVPGQGKHSLVTLWPQPLTRGADCVTGKNRDNSTPQSEKERLQQKGEKHHDKSRWEEHRGTRKEQEKMAHPQVLYTNNNFWRRPVLRVTCHAGQRTYRVKS